MGITATIFDLARQFFDWGCHKSFTIQNLFFFSLSLIFDVLQGLHSFHSTRVLQLSLYGPYALVSVFVWPWLILYLGSLVQFLCWWGKASLLIAPSRSSYYRRCARFQLRLPFWCTVGRGKTLCKESHLVYGDGQPLWLRTPLREGKDICLNRCPITRYRYIVYSLPHCSWPGQRLFHCNQSISPSAL